MKKIILIGGAPGTGKSTLAKELSNKLNIPWLSTDVIREWMKKIVSKKEYQDLFIFKSKTGDEHYRKFSPEETFHMEQKRDEDVIKGIISYIESQDEIDKYIIEGITIHPKYISLLKNLKIEYAVFFLVDKNEDSIKKVLNNRGLWAKNKEGKQKEEEYLEITNKYYINECIQHNFEYFDVGKDRKIIVEEIKRLSNKFINN